MKVSIITINYNNADGLQKTIDSVSSQTSNDYEFIIIDGGSSDGSKKIIIQNKDIINYWLSEPDKGIYNAMNKGISVANGDYCIFINSGDCFYDNEVIRKFICLNPQEDIVIGAVHSSLTDKKLFEPPQRDISFYYLYSSTIPHQGSFIKTNLQKKHLYDESLRIVADWLFFYQAIIIDNCTYKYINLSVAKFDTEGISTKNAKTTWEEKQKVLSKLYPNRLLTDYKWLKMSECLTSTLTHKLRNHYRIDKLLYLFGKALLFIFERNYDKQNKLHFHEV